MSGNEPDGFVWEPLFGPGLKRALSLQKETKSGLNRPEKMVFFTTRMLNTMTAAHEALE